jgi:hypothetical protein
MRLSRWTAALAIGVLIFVAAIGGAVAAFTDWGLRQQTQLRDKSHPLFGFGQPLTQSSTVDFTTAQALADPGGLITVAKDLTVSVVAAGPSDNAAPNIDQMILWPKSNPTHLIGCNEEGTTEPALQKISLATGQATTIATGIADCDPVRATPWGTVLFGEEAGSVGAMYELIDPLNVVNASINNVTGVTAAPYTNSIKRVNAFGFLSFEGLAVFPNGVTYYGDELGPSNGIPGGAYYKFVPDTPWAGGAPITSLSQSPYISGKVYSLRVGQGSNSGQGDAYGIGSWQLLASLNSGSNQQLRLLATANNRTGYYRPEDIAIDETALGAGNVRFCGNNTGRDSARYWGETICFTDGTVAQALANSATPQLQFFVQGSPQINMPDNIGFQASRGNWLIEEDGSTNSFVDGATNNDIWDCLPDEADDDTLSDGCVRVATLNDFDAESTGGFFDPTGKHYYVSIQHNSSGFGTILDITGWGSQGNP